MPPPYQPQEELSPAESRARTLAFFRALGADAALPASAERPDAYSTFVRALLSSAAVSASPAPRVSCTLTVFPAVTTGCVRLCVCRTCTTRSTAAPWRPWPRPSGWRARRPRQGIRRCSSGRSAPRTLLPPASILKWMLKRRY